VYHANRNIFKSKLISKKAKLKFYRNVRPVITYSSETWVLKESVKRKLLVTGRKIRRIFGPKKDRDCTWRIKTSDEPAVRVRTLNMSFTRFNYLF